MWFPEQIGPLLMQIEFVCDYMWVELKEPYVLRLKEILSLPRFTIGIECFEFRND